MTQVTFILGLVNLAIAFMHYPAIGYANLIPGLFCIAIAISRPAA